MDQQTAPSNRKVLIIDDSQLCCEMEAAILSRAGFDVRTAGSIEVFDRILHEWSPDIVLTDVLMPEIKGTELCRYVRRHVSSRHVPVVLFSSLREDVLSDLAKTCGADGYLSKHRGLNKLVEELETLWSAILW
jgi:PleD family two-component response regulator